MGSYDWRFSRRNVWAVENMLLDVAASQDQALAKRVRREREKYRAYLAKHKKKPLYYRGREKWTEIPKSFSSCHVIRARPQRVSTHYGREPESYAA